MGTRTIQTPIYERFCDRCGTVADGDGWSVPRDWTALTFTQEGSIVAQWDCCPACVPTNTGVIEALTDAD